VIRAALALLLVMLPVVAEACAACISSPFGDRTYTWPYLILILVPFAVAAVIVGVMVRVTGVGMSDLRRWLTRVFHSAAREEETT
jgi:hypothetical protein